MDSIPPDTGPPSSRADILPDLVPAAEPRAVFDEAAARGILVYEPRSAVNCIYHWICLGHDRRGNVWFRHCVETRHLVMPPQHPADITACEHTPDAHPEDRHLQAGRSRDALQQAGQQMAAPAGTEPGSGGSRQPARSRLATILPFPGAPPLRPVPPEGEA